MAGYFAGQSVSLAGSWQPDPLPAAGCRFTGLSEADILEVLP
jgi:hypothetical protein